MSCEYNWVQMSFKTWIFWGPVFVVSSSCHLMEGGQTSLKKNNLVWHPNICFPSLSHALLTKIAFAHPLLYPLSSDIFFASFPSACARASFSSFCLACCSANCFKWHFMVKSESIRIALGVFLSLARVRASWWCCITLIKLDDWQFKADHPGYLVTPTLTVTFVDGNEQQDM